MPNRPELTVKIAVPAETKQRDVQVRIEARRVRVAVAGHARQPTVVDGPLE